MTVLTITNLRPPVQNRVNLFLSLLKPAILLSAQVNDASIARGSRSIIYDSGTGSGFSTIANGMTLEVDTATGTEKIRIKSITGSQAAGTITVQENGINWSNDLVIRVLHNFELWAIPPAVRNGVFYKDYSISFLTQYATQPSPVAIIGSHLAGRLTAGTIARQIVTGADDGFVTSIGQFSNTGLTVGFGQTAGVDIDSWFRFQNVQIPAGATINSASLTLVSSASQSTTVTLKISGEDADNPAAPTSNADYNARVLTTAQVDWDFSTAWAADEEVSTPSLTAIIQEIVDRGGWASGNAIQIFIKNDGSTALRSVRSHNASPPQAAILNVTWAVGLAFSLNSSSSYAIAQGATISSRVWSCVHNGGGTGGISFSSTTAANPTLTITQADTYWLTCIVTDSNSQTQITHRAIFVYDDDNPPYIDFTVDSLSGDWDSAGWRCSLTLTGDLTLTDIPDNTLAVIWYENYFDGVEGYVNLWSPFGNNIVYAGYLWSDNDTDNWGTPDQGGGTSSASFEVVSPLQFLDSITDYGTVSLEASDSPANWSQYASWLTVGRGIASLLLWDTTILQTCDVLGLTTNTYGVEVLEFTEDTVLQRIQGVAYQRGIHAKLLDNRIGQLYLSVDSQMLNAAARAALDTIFSIINSDISGGVNLVRNETDIRAFADMDGFGYSHPTATAIISMIPGYIESLVSFNLPEPRGVGVATLKQQVLNSAGAQTDCNERVGRLLALENVSPREIRIDLRGNYLGAFDIVPSSGWYGWTVANNALARGLDLNGIKTLCRSVSHRFGYEGNRFNGVIQTSVVLQPEAEGPDGIPGNYPTSYPAIVTPAPASASPDNGPNLIAYVDAGDGQIKARIISYAGSLSIGSEVVVDASGGRLPTVVSLSVTKAVVCYTRSTSIYGCVLDVSGTTITPGTPAALSGISTDAGVNDGELDIDRISSTSALLIYRNGSGGVNAVVLSGMSGTTITTNTAANLTAVTSAQVTCVVMSSTVAMAFFVEDATAALDGCPIGLSGVTITPGSPTAIEGVDNIFGADAAKLDSSNIILCYNNQTDAQVQGRVISGITDSAFTSNAMVVIDTDDAFDAGLFMNKWVRAPSATQGTLVWQRAGGNFAIYAAGLEISGTTFTPSNPVQVSTLEEGYDETATCALISSTRALVVYDESGIATVGAHARSFTFTGSTDPVADNNDIEFMTDTFNQQYEFTSTTLED